jgi:hypothetical protein
VNGNGFSLILYMYVYVCVWKRMRISERKEIEKLRKILTKQIYCAGVCNQTLLLQCKKENCCPIKRIQKFVVFHLRIFKGRNDIYIYLIAFATDYYDMKGGSMTCHPNHVRLFHIYMSEKEKRTSFLTLFFFTFFDL